VVFVGEISEICELPHLRVDCTLHKYNAGNRSSFCNFCYCYICDAPVITCPDWQNHCTANPNDKAMYHKWKAIKNAYKANKKSGHPQVVDIVYNIAPQKQTKKQKLEPTSKSILTFFSKPSSSSSNNPIALPVVDLTVDTVTVIATTECASIPSSAHTTIYNSTVLTTTTSEAVHNASNSPTSDNRTSSQTTPIRNRRSRYNVEAQAPPETSIPPPICLPPPIPVCCPSDGAFNVCFPQNLTLLAFHYLLYFNSGELSSVNFIQ
jgi:hypothetical protein